jgi:hypothetical protein
MLPHIKSRILILFNIYVQLHGIFAPITKKPDNSSKIKLCIIPSPHKLGNTLKLFYDLQGRGGV